MTMTLAYDTGLSRVRVSVTGLAGVTTVERSADLVRWTTVRGGVSLTPTGGTISIDDYEFTPDVANTYRASGQTATITPAIDSVWIKSLARPFLNRPVRVVGWDDTTRPARAGVFDIIGRSMPVAVTEVRGSRRWSIDILTLTRDEATDIDMLAASGDTVLVQVPSTWPSRGGYVAIGDTTEAHPQRGSIERLWTLPLTEVAAPGPDVVGASSTWQTVINGYSRWQDVITAKPRWADLLELVGNPTDVIVS
ncbi:hypothetical protein ABZ671_00890 [Micromonospora sp. NPDC006766]|uniref:hypothetical protein n=1 Tax=Micromonospora sp. NPDC006766 TaxID=3154778 RepID=UPI003406A569